MTMPMTPSPVTRALRLHLRDVSGLTAAQVFVGEQGDWTEAARMGPVDPDAYHPVLSGFDAQAGGAIEPLEGGGWQASYMTADLGLDLVLLLRLGPIPAAQLEAQLALIEARVGWILVAAASDRQSAAAARAIGADLTGPILLDAARARSPRRLADQWIARLERALRPDLAAIVWIGSGKARLTALSGGGLVERPSDARDGLERLAAIADRHRGPMLVGEGLETADPADVAMVEVTRLDAGCAMLVPIEDNGRTAAVAVLIWKETGVAPHPQIADAVAAALAEALVIQRAAHPSLLRRTGNWGAGLAIAVFGRTAWKLKVAVALIVIAGIIAAAVPSRYQPSFAARIEATDRRIVAAPFDGVLARADFETGDVVDAGAVLVAMEDTDLRLELARAQARLEGVEAELQTARARRETAQVRLLEAQSAQVVTEIGLLERQLDLARAVAATRSIVVGGDARRRVGGRVRLGDPLLEIAAPDSVRLLVFLDEDWVAELAVGQPGTALLAAYPSRPVPATLSHIGAAPQDREGVNVFPAVFDIVPPADMRILDGMRGVVRLGVGETSVLSARTRGLQRWLSRAAWRSGLGQ
jgi:biotin carboxyl carrier protein